MAAKQLYEATESCASPVFVTRGTDGIKVWQQQSTESISTISTQSDLRSMVWSPDGKQLAYSTREGVTIWDVSSDAVGHQLEYPATRLAYSPLGTYLLLWQPYVVVQGESGKANLHVVGKDGGLIEEYFQKRQENWLVQWSMDETMCARNVTNEVHFFDGGQPGRFPSSRLQIENLTSFSISRGPSPFHVSVHIKGTKGAPSVVRLYCYPHFTGAGAVVANKSFYKADTVQMKWDNDGKGVLVLTATEVDKTGASYYGEQGLYYLTIRGESFMVQLDKKGPIYAVEWSPIERNFCVVYGFMPSKAALFNSKCDLIFDFGITHRNTALFNRHGNLLCLAGFGNLRGSMEFWNVATHKLIGKVQASDSTFLEWSPDGAHVVTATTAPRLRVGNGFKIWNFTGTLLLEVTTPPKQELWEVSWQPQSHHLPPDITSVPDPSATVLTVRSTEAKQEVYIPPSLRGKPRPVKKEVTDETEAMTKSSVKNRKKRDAQKRTKLQERSDERQDAITTTGYMLKPEAKPGGGGDEKDKRLKSLKKKLRQIETLREQLAGGRVLEANQVEKLKSEQPIVEEIAQLEL